MPHLLQTLRGAALVELGDQLSRLHLDAVLHQGLDLDLEALDGWVVPLKGTQR